MPGGSKDWAHSGCGGAWPPHLFAPRPSRGALASLFHWANFVDPLLYRFDAPTYTHPLGLRALFELGPSDFGTLMAAALVATVPAVVAFALVQRQFLRSTRLGGWVGR